MVISIHLIQVFLILEISTFSKVERITAIILIVVGAGFYSFMIGSISTILSNLDTRRAHLQNKITIMDEFCNEAKIKPKLKLSLRKALTYISIKSIFS